MPVAAYAPARMTDLKVSVTGSIGMQARHRMIGSGTIVTHPFKNSNDIFAGEVG
jgi:hypothetical protein